MRLLLVEDDTMIGESIAKGLRREGFAVDWVKDGIAAERSLEAGDFDLMLLDLGLPRKGGLDVLRTLRAKGKPIPVLILTARDAVPDRVMGLNAGADDYLVKPFDLDELVARIHAILRRRSGRAEPVIHHGSLVLNPISHELSLDGRPLVLSAREFSLLLALLERPGAVLSVPQLQERIYGWDEEVGSNTVEVFIHALRKKLGPDFIKNVRGIGYMVPRLP
ncbi:transcriptional regulatory protein QseB [mine drainage metagenome]|uniref:Transcriptional regulatory protein QseB n=1 Tax=mine drainage metagenome TaxID=410659 RepID=A0A1J5RLM1_9ZZZZ